MATNTPFTSLRLVNLDHIVENLAEEAYKDLQRTLNGLKTESSDEDKSVALHCITLHCCFLTYRPPPFSSFLYSCRKRTLLHHLNATKQRLLRLNILIQWCHKSPAVAECKRVLEVSSTHVAAFRDAADQLAYLHGELLHTKAPAYDVPTAMHVLGHGNFIAGLPSLIETEAAAVAPAVAAAASAAGAHASQRAAKHVEQGNAALRRMDFIIRSKLLEEGASVPQGLRVVRVGGGEVVVRRAK